MCFGGGGNVQPTIQAAPVQTPPPKPSPLPAPVPTETQSATTAEARRRRIQQVRFGMLSTIKTSPQGVPAAKGVTGARVDLNGSSGKTSLGV